MSGKKIIITVVLVVVLLGAVAFAFFALQKKKPAPQPAQVPTATTGSGGVGNSPGTVAVVTPGFQIHQDPAAPFSKILPRQGLNDELALQPKPVLTAPAPQQQQTPTIDPSDISNPDYANLSSSQFLAKYYPDANQVISGQSAANPPGTDPALVSYGPVQNTQSIPDNPAISSSKFNVTDNNSPQALSDYVQNFKNQVSSLDLVTNLNPLINLVQNPDPNAIAQELKQVQTIITGVQDVPTPSSVIGMQKTVFGLYQSYSNFLRDLDQLNSSGPQSDANLLASQIKNDATSVSDAFNQLNQDQTIIDGMIGQ